jgi:hypothetical protein
VKVIFNSECAHCKSIQWNLSINFLMVGGRGLLSCSPVPRHAVLRPVMRLRMYVYDVVMYMKPPVERFLCHAVPISPCVPVTEATSHAVR